VSQKTFVEKTATIGPVTVIRDWSMGKYGVSASCDDWSTDIYEFTDVAIADSVFDLVVSVVVEMSPEVQRAQIKLIPESEQ
jgi:hypothetical protein